jgi:hypothetical protein
MLAGNNLSGLSSTRKGRSNNNIPIFCPYCFRCEFYLFNPRLVHWDVSDTLQQKIYVPIGLTVPEQP